MAKAVRFCWLAAFFLLSACAAVGPDYVAPELPTPAAWRADYGGGENQSSSEAENLAGWWVNFNDSLLSALIDSALAGNLDFKQALSRLREARLRRGESEAALWPSLDLTADTSQSRSGSAPVRRTYGTGFDAGWELDLFGGIRRSREAALADEEAVAADLGDVLVSLTAEVGLNYIELRTYQARLAVARANLQSQQETHDLIAGRYEAGLGSELALQQARYNLASTRGRIPGLVSGVAAALNQLTLLCGQVPGSLNQPLQKPAALPAAPLALAVGIPAQTLSRRPDIRKAERELAARTARIGVAEAELYPKIRLSGSIGLESGKLADLFAGEAFFWSHGPRFSWNVFDAGALRLAVKVEEEKQVQALLAYQGAVLKALAEVEDAMTVFAQEQLRRRQLEQAEAAAQIAERLAREKFAAGLVDFSEVLDAQRTLLSFQDQLAECTGNLVADLIRLYKALGGGWSPALLDKGISTP